MGTNSTIHRYREAGESANVNNVERFGNPGRSLFTSTKVLTLHHRIEVTDCSENTVYRAVTKFPSLHDKTDITDASGNFVAHIQKKFLSFHERHYVTMADGLKFEISNEFFHVVRDITNIEGLGWQLRGNILGMNFELYDGGGDIIAVISQKLFSLHDKYCMDIYKTEYEQIVVAILITLQHMISDRSSGSSSAAASSGS